ncbi:MAG: VOC family protein [Gammaproteobacteria bacterium]|nr:VOC family protein [Gammaproteobacteria bacterium]
MAKNNKTVCGTSLKSRRDFIASSVTMLAGFGLPASSALGARQAPPLPIRAFSHMMLAVSDPDASTDWYQRLFGLPVVSRRAEAIILQVGEGPQFIGISGQPDNSPRIASFGLALRTYDPEKAVQALQEQGVTPTGMAAPMQSFMRLRKSQKADSVDTQELWFGDPDGIVVQLQDSSYCGGEGTNGEICFPVVESESEAGLLSIREFNHFTVFVSDQARSIRFYQSLFGMPIDTYQGALPIIRVGTGRAFLALAQPPVPPRIHHASLAVENFNVERIFAQLESFGLTILGEASAANGPLQAYVTMRGADRGGLHSGTPEVYFTDPDGILLQLQDLSYCGGNGYFGELCGTVDNPTGRNE